MTSSKLSGSSYMEYGNDYYEVAQYTTEAQRAINRDYFVDISPFHD